jgi:hypothetical protein
MVVRSEPAPLGRAQEGDRGEAAFTVGGADDDDIADRGVRIAPSISSVPSRWPETLMTSSLRPWKEKLPSWWRIAKSPWV